MKPVVRPLVRRNYYGSGLPCNHCGRDWAMWECPTGLRCTICCNCAGLYVTWRLPPCQEKPCH